ncbi:phosphoglycerate kinase [Kyrpidia tusciae]|uniref:Phosphoglycerate kinase n=1 Tax=Kyrpidia tusciae (strain DSM 2912 / NBRC 15312 / T2) TaxID=562970 RepID=D5WV30_KYRT2|nr:phosphoglycerate kinase [Kyrpidia tusciae]ADG07502.1 Phosphoglycerate kinase [Kyrpidia tusciae DSM 2912]
MKATIRDADVTHRRVFVRVDYNVPIKDGQITDDTRIRASLPTLEDLIQRGAKLILASHLGRPKGAADPAYSLAPVAAHLSRLLRRPVAFPGRVVGPELAEFAQRMQPGEVLLLENVRFHPGETRNDPELARSWADLAELYVSDAFGTAHRAHASTVGVAEHLPAYAGYLMDKEITVLSRVLTAPQRPFVAVIGGAKIKDKIGVIERLLQKVDVLLLGGGLANTFLAAKGFDVGASLYEPDNVDVARRLLEQAELQGTKLLLPVDVVTAPAPEPDAPREIVDISSIPDGSQALDIGPKTVEQYRRELLSARLILWNGPMGVFEVPPFAEGTYAVARAVADSEAESVIGGGDSLAAIEGAGLAHRISHLSTGGGATLEFLEGKILPGVAVLQDRA